MSEIIWFTEVVKLRARHSNLTDGRGLQLYLVFRKKDLHLVITQKLTKLYMKSAVLFMKSGAFCEKCSTLHEKHYAFHEKHLKSEKQHWKATKTADSTQISHLDLVFHRVQREDQLCMFWWCLVVHMCLLVHVVYVCVCDASMHTYMCLVVQECKQVVFHAWNVALCMKSTWKVKSTWKAP